MKYRAIRYSKYKWRPQFNYHGQWFDLPLYQLGGVSAQTFTSKEDAIIAVKYYTENDHDFRVYENL